MSENSKSFFQMRPAWSLPNVTSGPRVRKVQKALYNFQVTLLCGFVTFVVLRGTIGSSLFGASENELDTSGSARFPSGQRTMMEFKSKTLDDIDASFEAERLAYDTNFDPSKYFDPGAKHHTLGEAVTDWDEQRGAYLSESARGGNATGVSERRPRILLVSGSQPKPCDNPNGDYLLLKNLKNKVDYCRLHGIEIFYNMAHLSRAMSGFWAKLPLIRTLMLAHPDVEWIWWMDSDAFFTDMQFTLPLAKYEGFNLVVHGWNDLLYQQKSWIGLNTGSFLIRNCQWSLDILDAWAPFGPIGKPRTEAGKLLTKHLSGRPNFEADDQSALIYLLLSQKERWAEKTYLESSFYLHGYWMILVENFERMMEDFHPGFGDDRWPFVTHFVGCKPCHGSSGDFSIESCTKQMERAFNFADNQILQAYGFHHPELGSSQVTKSSAQVLGTSKLLRGKARVTT